MISATSGSVSMRDFSSSWGENVSMGGNFGVGGEGQGVRLVGAW
jgi:hypothetical protein